MQALAIAEPPTVPRHLGRPRCDTTRKAVLGAAYDILAEGGLTHFTIETVAARSGVARSTIYRWWPSKGALATEGFLEATAADLALPPSGSAVADLEATLRLFARLVRGKAGRIIRCIIAEGQSHPETIEAFVSGFVTPRRAEIGAIVARGIAAGELRADLDIEMVLYSLFGPIYLRMLLNESMEDAWVDRLSSFALAGWRAA